MAVNKVEYFGKVILDLTEDTVTPETLAEGVTAHDKSGAKVIGKFTLENEMTAQDGLIAAIKTALQGKAAGGSNEPQTATIYYQSAPNSSVKVFYIDSNGSIKECIVGESCKALNGIVFYLGSFVLQGTSGNFTKSFTSSGGQALKFDENGGSFEVDGGSSD